MKLQYKILVGTSTNCWAIWPCRNDVVFSNEQNVTYMQVIYRGTYWIHLWTLRQKEEEISQFQWGAMCWTPRLWTFSIGMASDLGIEFIDLVLQTLMFGFFLLC